MSRHPFARQRGATLVTVLILLVVMTLLGLAGVRTTVLQERMTAGTFDRNLAFQAAEAALVQGEEYAKTRPTAPASGCTVDGRLCSVPVAGAAPRWKNSSVWSAVTAITGLGGATGQAAAGETKYFLELVADYVPLDPKSCTTRVDISVKFCEGKERRYRVTARSTATGRAAVVLQSIYSVPINP